MTRLHFIAIGGSIMHSLAIDMHNKGYAVTGSDDEIYEPSKGRLAKAGLLPDKIGWRPEIITNDIDLVVLGMHARKDNPELTRAKELGIEIKSFPEFIYDISSAKKRVVVAGSHGKTTTSGMIAHLLHSAGIPADRMIGAQIGTLAPVTISDAGIIVLEGDEYLSSPEDPRPKFIHYKPNITVITGIAWDHMNVFPTYQSYIEPFKQLIESQTAADTLIYCTDDADLVKLIDEISPSCELIPYSVFSYDCENGNVFINDDKGNAHSLRIFGIHNMQNLAAAFHVTQKLGLSADEFYKGASTFEGALKRLQLIYKSNNLIAYLDFAHAPSKVKATVHAVREKHKNAYIIAILELHTFSSLNPDFLPQYKDSLKYADQKLLYYSPHTLSIKKLPDLSPALLASFFGEKNLLIATSGQQLESVIRTLELKENTVLLWMSSGRFDGLDIKEISESLSSLGN
jgi:UDP-N-acetylmuramate: L-alanyl-gamma-D-glutamyl-meso-diaminopimelate ligase